MFYEIFISIFLFDNNNFTISILFNLIARYKEVVFKKKTENSDSINKLFRILLKYLFWDHINQNMLEFHLKY